MHCSVAKQIIYKARAPGLTMFIYLYMLLRPLRMTPTFILFSVKLCTTQSFFHTFIIHTWNKVRNIYKAIAINKNFNKCPYIQLLATSYTYDILYTKASSSSNEGKSIKNNKI